MGEGSKNGEDCPSNVENMFLPPQKGHQIPCKTITSSTNLKLCGCFKPVGFRMKSFPNGGETPFNKKLKLETLQVVPQLICRTQAAAQQFPAAEASLHLQFLQPGAARVLQIRPQHHQPWSSCNEANR